MRQNRPLAACVSLAVATAAAVAQEAPLAGLYTRTTFAAADEIAMDAWVESLIRVWNDNADKSAADIAFRKAVATELANPAATLQFRSKLVDRIAVVFNQQFGKGAQLDVTLARTLAHVLGELDHVNAIPALEQGLGFPDAEVRYRCAHAFIELQKNISGDRNLSQKVFLILQNAGARETSPVVLSRIYVALMKEYPPADTIAVGRAILDARLARWRQGPYVADPGDLPFLEFLLANTKELGANPARIEMVARLATMLRLDVQRYTDAKFRQQEREALERRINLEERLLVALVSPSPPPNIVGAMSAGGANGRKGMLDGLELWIGTPAKPGLLNSAPWNVPPGAP